MTKMAATNSREIHAKRQNTLWARQAELHRAVSEVPNKSATVERFLANVATHLEKKMPLSAVMFSNLKELANKAGITQGKGFRGTHGFNTGYNPKGRGAKKDSKDDLNAATRRAIESLAALPKPLKPPLSHLGVPHHKTRATAQQAADWQATVTVAERKHMEKRFVKTGRIRSDRPNALRRPGSPHY